jgi:membrane-associated phospholipid phosphatase
MEKERNRSINPFEYKAAKFISVLGHPLLIGSLVSAFVFFELYSREKALLLSFFVIGLVSLPLTAWNFYKTKSGGYTNFDVSIRSQRSSMYAVLLGLLSLACLLGWFSNQPRAFSIGLSTCLALVLISFLINFFLKTSLHAAISFYLAFGLLALHISWGMGMLFLAVLVSISRLRLKRHNRQEVISGFFIGSGAGALFICWVHAL